MNILAVSHDIPRPDQSSGELRFFTLLSLLTHSHHVLFYSKNQQCAPERNAAAEGLRRLGIRIEKGTFEHLLRNAKHDVVLFEFFVNAEDCLDLVRAWQPRSRIVVDSVDVHFHRLRSKARLTGLAADRDYAEAVRDRELSVYRKADLVLTVSEEETRILRDEGLRSDIDVVPNIHVMQPLVSHSRSNRLELIFIGG